MTEKITPAKELPPLLVKLRDGWYSIAHESGALRNYKTVTQSGFKRAIKKLSSRVSSTRSMLIELDDSLKGHFPSFVVEVGNTVERISSSIEELEAMIKADLDDITKFKKQYHKLGDMVGELVKIEKKYKAIEKRANEECKKYFDMRNEYTRKLLVIKDSSKAKIDKIAGNFARKVFPILRGYRALVPDTHETLDVARLFKILSEKPKEAMNLVLVPISAPKGVFSIISKRRFEREIEAKLSVLKYTLQETGEELNLVKEGEAKKVAELKSEYKELEELERRCESLEEDRRKLEERSHKFRENIEEIKERQGMRFSDYTSILNIKKEYSNKFNEINPKIKRYLSNAEKVLKEYQVIKPIEEDEKLRGKVEELSEKVKGLEIERADLQKRFKEVRKEKNKLEAKLSRLRKEYNALKSKYKKSSKELRTAMAKIKKLGKG